MSHHQSFKQRQSNRLNYAIMREQAEEQMRRDQEQAEARLQNELDALEAIERATHKAFASIEKNLTAHGEVER